MVEQPGGMDGFDRPHAEVGRRLQRAELRRLDGEADEFGAVGRLGVVAAVAGHRPVGRVQSVAVGVNDEHLASADRRDDGDLVPGRERAGIVREVVVDRHRRPLQQSGERRVSRRRAAGAGRRRSRRRAARPPPPRTRRRRAAWRRVARSGSIRHQPPQRLASAARPAPASARRPAPGTAPGAASACRCRPASACRHAPHSVEPNSTPRPVQLVEHRPARGQRRLVVRGLQAPGAGHAGAAHVDGTHPHARGSSEQPRPGGRPAQRLDVARDVVPERDVEPAEVGPQLAPPRAARHRNAVSSTVFAATSCGVRVVEQVEVVLRQHQRGGRLGADDAVPLADQRRPASGRCTPATSRAVSTSP